MFAVLVAQSRARSRHCVMGLRPTLDGAPRTDGTAVIGMREHLIRRSRLARRQGAGFLRRPLGYAGSWYEEGKRVVTLVILPEPKYSAGLAIGCSTGILTGGVAARMRRTVRVRRCSLKKLSRVRTPIPRLLQVEIHHFRRARGLPPKMSVIGSAFAALFPAHQRKGAPGEGCLLGAAHC